MERPCLCLNNNCVCVQDPSAEFHLNLGEVVRQVTALYRADGPIPRIRTLDLQVYVNCSSLPLFSPRLFVVVTICTVPVPTRSVSEHDPDMDWIRIQSGQWIRIRIWNPNPDPGWQKMTHKKE
jgi:hypothetical protein